MRSFIIFMIVIALANSKTRTPVNRAKVLTPFVAKECNQKVSSLLGVVLESHPSIAMSQDFANAETLGRWITYYYTKPEPRRVAPKQSAPLVPKAS